MLLAFIFLLLAGSDVAWSQRGCSRDRMRQCSDTLLRNIQRRILDMSRTEMTSHCRNIRDDFNCLLRETRCLTSESERNRNGDTLRNAVKYIRDGCDTGGGSWRDSTCFIGDNIKTCENSYPLGGTQFSSYNPETCRKFNLFQECVTDIVRTRCRPEEESMLGQYLVDTAQDLAWNCGDTSSSTSSSSSDWDRNRDDRYDRNGDRDRDRDREYDRSRDSWRDRGSSRDRDRERDRDQDRYSDRYDRDRYDRNYGRDGTSDVTCCRNERCSSNRMQQCRDSLSRAIDSRTSGYQDSQKCRQTRDDFNCLLWQTSNCQSRNERDRDNDIFRRAKDFISKNCDSYGRWSENSCYKSTEMQRCESSFTNTRTGASYDSCRMYNNFRDCMQDELQRRCTREDELFQGAYLVDKAQELSWQCGTEQYNGRNQYITDNRRDSFDTYGQDTPQHLENEDAMCLSRIQAYSERCKATMDEKKREVYITNEYEARQKINCCAIRNYRTCLYDATRRVCQSERRRVVDSLMGRYTYELTSDNCIRIHDSDCNNANQYQISMLLIFVCTLVLQRIFTNHL